MSRTYQPVKRNPSCNCDDEKKQCTYDRRYAEMSSSSGVLGENLGSFGNQSELAPKGMDVDGGVMVLGEITPPEMVFFHSNPFRSLGQWTTYAYFRQDTFAAFRNAIRSDGFEFHVLLYD
ncbi:hypothetical protein F3Y22_tig00116964pilonHSYRG00199 [Hibiscus syriacus]|uniref:Uncharacterized protein n=1 Tax=Hibiscus syriacus TaxID=106335 RepID=A0A6A2WKA0_HIBSY|nr:hypothetical protein F3Y22_tig00116964pilonHSYRG00199 [Hibiscus syriacus]